MRLPNLQPLASAFNKHGVTAAHFLLRAILEPARSQGSKQEPRTVSDRTVDQVAVATPPAHVPCKIYYPRRQNLNAEQLAFYLYWRAQFEAGFALPADATYRFLYANESPAEVKTAAELDARWSALCRAYLSDERFASYIATWTLDLRFLMDRYVVDAVLEASHDPGLQLDVALLADVAPSWGVLVASVLSDHTAQERVAAFLADGYADMKSIVSLAASVGPRPLHEQFFRGLPTSLDVSRLLPTRQNRPSFLANPAFREPIEALVAQAGKVIGITTSAKRDQQFVVTGSAEVRVPIVRATLPVRPEPPADTLDGLLSIVRHGLDDDARMLLAVVLATSERLPYVEGRVDAAKNLRESFEAFSTACGRKATLGVFRSAFFELGAGERAIWKLEPPVTEPIEIKMSQVVSRFTKGLQHHLSGTNARRTVIDCLVEILSKRTGRSKVDLIDALATICGSTSSILPNRNREEVA